MKKHNDGYALPFVLVVMLVLAIVATSVMSAALQNLQTQQRTIERMEDKYKAQGAVEIIAAHLSKGFELSSLTELPTQGEGETEEKFKVRIESVIKAAINEEIGKICDHLDDPSKDLPVLEDKVNYTRQDNPKINCDITIESQYDTVEIKCVLNLTGNLYTKNNKEPTVYAIVSPTVTYKSYEISNIGDTNTQSVTVPTETPEGGGTG